MVESQARDMEFESRFRFKFFSWNMISTFFYRTTLLEKYPTLFYVCEYLVDFNEARLHEATLNLHMHA
jgi:hypothetical protein